jgi:hypothetical protein
MTRGHVKVLGSLSHEGAWSLSLYLLCRSNYGDKMKAAAESALSVGLDDQISDALATRRSGNPRYPQDRVWRTFLHSGSQAGRSALSSSSLMTRRCSWSSATTAAAPTRSRLTRVRTCSSCTTSRKPPDRRTAGQNRSPSGVRGVLWRRFASGAPRPMKMGNILSPWRYDGAAYCAIQSAKLRCSVIQRCASLNPSRALRRRPNLRASIACAQTKETLPIYVVSGSVGWDCSIG